MCDMHYQQVRKGKTPGPSRYVNGKTTRALVRVKQTAPVDDLKQALNAYQNAVGVQARIYWRKQIDEMKNAREQGEVKWARNN